MLGADDDKVAAVQGRQWGSSQPFGQGDQRGVGTTEAEICVLLDQVTDARPVVVGQGLDREHTSVIDLKRAFGTRPQLAVDEVGRLGDHQGARDEWSRVGFEQLPALPVVGVIDVRGGHQRASVDQQRSVAPEPVSQQLVGVLGSAAGAGGSGR